MLKTRWKLMPRQTTFFEMLNGHPPQRHKLGTIILNGDTQKRKEHHLSNILWGVTERQHRGRQKHKNGHNSGPWASPRWSSIDEDQHARPYMGLKHRANTRQHFVEEQRQITNKQASNNGHISHYTAEVTMINYWFGNRIYTVQQWSYYVYMYICMYACI